MLDHSTFIDDDSKGKIKSGFGKHTIDGMAF